MLWVSGPELTRGMPSLNPEPCGRLWARVPVVYLVYHRPRLMPWYTWTARRKRPAAPLVEYWSCEHVRAVERAACEHTS